MNETGLPTASQVFAETTFDAIIFDMDGTLISSIQSTERAWGTWMACYGMDPDHYHQFHGVPAAQIVAQVLPPELREEGFNRIVNLELTDTDGITLLPGAGPLWHSIDPQRRAIATSCVRDLAEVRMGITGLATPIVVTADDVDNGKPNPEPFIKAAQLLGVDPRRCLVFEDAPSGLAAARAAGCATIAVPGTNNLAELDADAYAQTLEGLTVVTNADNTLSLRLRGQKAKGAEG